MALLGKGALLNWGGVLPKHDLDYHLWHSLEHMPERMSVKGFLLAFRCVGHKGTNENDKYFTNWVRHLSYFNIEKWEDRIKNLDKYDTSGLNYIKNPKGNKNKLVRQSIRMLEKSDGYHRAKHYAGNFWWANSNHIKKMKKPSDLVLCGNYLKRRWIAEFWIGGEKPNAYTDYVDFANFKN